MDFNTQEREAVRREVAAAEAALAAQSRAEREAVRSAGASIAARLQDEQDLDRRRKLDSRTP
ncbi:MAG TPA: hypothetical protein VN200_11480 [Rhodoglobus sp.]|nr:hypothetical protein [Rhodoglobus sp.]